MTEHCQISCAVLADLVLRPQSASETDKTRWLWESNTKVELVTPQQYHNCLHLMVTTCWYGS